MKHKPTGLRPAANDRMWWEYYAEQERQNPAMPKTTAERQAEFKQAMKEAGFVRLEAYVTKEQREKFRQLGGDDWLRKRIDRAKLPDER